MSDLVKNKESAKLKFSESPVLKRLRAVECAILDGGSISSWDGTEVFSIVGSAPEEITNPGNASSFYQDFTISNGNAAVSSKTAAGGSWGNYYSNQNFCNVASRAFSKGTWRFTIGYDVDFAVSNFGATPVTLAAGSFKIYINTATVSQPSYATSSTYLQPLSAALFCSMGGYEVGSTTFSEDFIVTVSPTEKYKYGNPKTCTDLVFTSDCYFNLSIRITMTSMAGTGPTLVSPQNMPGFLNSFTVSASRLD